MLDFESLVNALKLGLDFLGVGVDILHFEVDRDNQKVDIEAVTICQHESKWVVDYLGKATSFGRWRSRWASGR